MKRFILPLMVSLTTVPALAGFTIIGKTRDCSQKILILEASEKSQHYLLAVSGTSVTKLSPTGMVGPVRHYFGSVEEAKLGEPTGFEAAIMDPEMSRLSELKIFLSGAVVECFIQP